MLPNQQERFVRTSNNKHSDCIDGYGLTKQCAEQVINILNKIKEPMQNALALLFFTTFILPVALTIFVLQ